MVFVSIRAAMPQKAMATRDSQNKRVAKTDAEKTTRETDCGKIKFRRLLK